MATISHSNDENQIIEANMGLVNSVVKTFNPTDPNSFDEYIQAGRIGLMKAARNYDESRGSKFSTIAWHTINWEILSHIDTNKTNTVQIIEEPTSGTVEDITEYFPESLTDKELKVLNLRKEGHTFKKIGSILGQEYGMETGYSKSWANLLFHNSLEKIREANGIV